MLCIAFRYFLKLRKLEKSFWQISHWQLISQIALSKQQAKFEFDQLFDSNQTLKNECFEPRRNKTTPPNPNGVLAWEELK